jgi:hypothetical protein
VASLYGLNAKLSVNNVNRTGLLTGKNIGTVNYVVTSSDANKSSLTSNGSYVGGFVGQNGDGAKEGIINNCINYMNVSGTADESYAAGIAGVAGGKSTISICDNRATVSANTTAAGILAASDSKVDETNNVSITDCVNIGSISGNASAKAGIAGGTNNIGTFELCRNYGIIGDGTNANNYGITTGDAKRIYGCLEASGLNEGPVSSDTADAELTDNPIAPVADRSSLVRDFYISGTVNDSLAQVGTGYYEEKYEGPGSQGHTYADIDFTKNSYYRTSNSLGLIVDQLWYQVKNNFKDHYLRGKSNTGTILGQPIYPVNDPTNIAFIIQLYKDMNQKEEYDGVLGESFENFLRNCFYVYRTVYSWNDLHTNYDGLIDFIEVIVANHRIPSEYGESIYYDGKDADDLPTETTKVYYDDYSHWPKQLYFHTGDDGSVTLAYHRWQSYYASPIAGLDNDVINDASVRFGQIDQKFVAMVNNTDDYPNNDQMGGDGTIVKQGFLPQQP